ncbi:thermonuclease family protein [Bacillus solitudinis]|uniref:thermonuclease family protein n=1 Tax=Bacillus solitudinis TaxID=2014074 RepID=UPI001D0D4BA2|nr:thermonuclease family protein [Bacillus solitudinis]
MKHYLLIFFFSFSTFYLFAASTGEAHNGSLDKLGGHFRNTDCKYLLHKPTNLIQTASSKPELFTLIKNNNNNNSCTSELTKEMIDLASAASPTELILGQSYTATLEKCTDGDTANFNVLGTTYKTRFLYIDTPENTNQVEPFGREASDFTCHFLKQGAVTLETDGPELFDRYNRLLAWVWVEDLLHQEVITKAGLVEKFYDYGTYLYEEQVITAMDEARDNRVGIYGIEEVEEEHEQDHSISIAPVINPSEVNTKETKTSDESLESDSGFGIVIFALALLIMYFWIPKIQAKARVKSLIIHHLQTKKVWLNLLLSVALIVFWYVLLIIVIIEVVHLLKNLKKPQSKL